MQIDWLTVTAQIVNFLVLVWLLQRFLYKPITKAMRRREKRIEERLEEARTAREEAEDEAKRLKDERAALDDSKDEILDEARQKADELRERLENEIREEIDHERTEWREHLAEEREAFIASLRRQAGQKVLEISQKVLTDYTESDLSKHVIATFADRLKSLDTDTHAKMIEAAAEEGAEATVFCGSVIDRASKGKITRTIHDTLSSDLDVTYEEDPDMLLGVRLTIGDYSAEWSAMRYLERLETELRDIMDTAIRNGGREKADSADTSEIDERKTA